jgi:hypothetical protein
VPKSVKEMKCSVCVHAFVVLDSPEHRRAGLSMNRLAQVMGAQWRDVSWHVRNHLAAAGWVAIKEASGKGSKCTVRLVHNPASCRDLGSRAARPLTSIADVKKPARQAPKLGTPAEQPLHPGRGDLCTPEEEVLHPGRALSVAPLSFDLSQPRNQPPTDLLDDGEEAAEEADTGRTGDSTVTAVSELTSPSADEPDGEERSSPRLRPGGREPRDAVTALLNAFPLGNGNDNDVDWDAPFDDSYAASRADHAAKATR